MDKKYDYYDDVKKVIYNTLNECLNDKDFVEENNIDVNNYADVYDKCQDKLIDDLYDSVPYYTDDILNHIADNPDLAYFTSEDCDLTMKDFCDNPEKFDYAMREHVYYNVVIDVVKTVVEGKDLDVNNDNENISYSNEYKQCLDDIAYDSLKDTLENVFDRDTYTEYLKMDLDDIKNEVLKNVSDTIEDNCRYEDDALDRILRGDYLYELEDVSYDTDLTEFFENPSLYEHAIIYNLCEDIDFDRVFYNAKYDVEHDIIEHSDMKDIISDYVISKNEDLVSNNTLNANDVYTISNELRDYFNEVFRLEDFFAVDENGKVSIKDVDCLSLEVKNLTNEIVNGKTISEKDNDKDINER